MTTDERYTLLIGELRELRAKRAQMIQSLTEHQKKEDQAIEEFKWKNPNTPFPGSPEWRSLRDESKEITRPLAEVEERIDTVRKEMEALSPTEEIQEPEEEEDGENEDDPEEPTKLTTDEIKAIAARSADRVVDEFAINLQANLTKELGLQQKTAQEALKAEKEAEKCPCENLQPMAEWIKGETPGTCRPCTLGPVIQWYHEELKDRGYEKEAQDLEEAVDSLEEDNLEQVVAVCNELDEIKKASPEDLRKRLEEFDCAIQSFDPAEVSEKD